MMIAVGPRRVSSDVVKTKALYRKALGLGVGRAQARPEGLDVVSAAPMPFSLMSIDDGQLAEARMLFVIAASSATPPPAPSRATAGMELPPLAGFSGSPEAIDASLQATPLCRVLKREFPEWYAERLKEAAALAVTNRDDAAIEEEMARALVEHHPGVVRELPQAQDGRAQFYDNLVELKRQSNEHCLEFISHGEGSAVIVALLRGSPHVARLQAQLTAVFESVADGRSAARIYPLPYQADYSALAAT